MVIMYVIDNGYIDIIGVIELVVNILDKKLD